MTDVLLFFIFRLYSMSTLSSNLIYSPVKGAVAYLDNILSQHSSVV